MLQTSSFTIHLTAPSLAESYLGEPAVRTQQRIAWGIALSLCVHGLLLVLLPKPDLSAGATVQARQGPLVVQLTPLARSSPQITSEVIPPPPTPRAPRRPQMMTVPSPIAQSTPYDPAPPTPLRPPEDTPTDFMSMVNARRAQRATAEAAAAEQRRANGREPSADDVAMASISRNLASLSQKGGTSGVFQILSKGHRAAQFSFNGWTGDRSNSHRDVIDVDAGLNGNIEVAIVRRMIELIRTHYQGDFNWESQRLGRMVRLSARVEDTVGLEEFMMREFFR
jgi:hypothetical protein